MTCPDPIGPALVLGLGASGAAAARLLRAEGRPVLALDAASGPDQERRAADLRAAGVDVRLAAGDDLPREPWALAVVSPGLAPTRSPWMSALRRRGIPVWPEFEWGWMRRGGARAIAVTGSNGKSTAVKLIAESLGAAGLRAAVAGNYGPPVCDVVRMTPAPDWLVMEVSSFQLETARAFRPDIGLLLNVQPNHLDRHGSPEEYLRVKSRIFEHSGAGTTCVLPFSLATMAGPARVRGADVRTFGTDPEADVRWDRGRVRFGGVTADARGTYFDNEVLGLAFTAATAALAAAGDSGAAITLAARAFHPLPHRLQTVAERDGIRWIDDSKATSLTAMIAALRMLNRPRSVRLLAGGRAKESDFKIAKEMLAFSAVKIYLFGESADAMSAAWSGSAPCEACGTLERAVRAAHAEAVPGDVILLSPGCASFDQFRSFEERGEMFARWADRLSGTPREIR